jgi:hypothetical protein
MEIMVTVYLIAVEQTGRKWLAGLAEVDKFQQVRKIG